MSGLEWLPEVVSPDLSALGGDFGDDGGDVVATATSNGLVDQVVNDRGDVVMTCHGTRDLCAG